jgi:hypothetical protein
MPTSCGCGWSSTPVRAILPVLHLGPRTQNAAHAVIHALRRAWAAFLPPTLHQRRSQLVFLCGSRPLSDSGSWDVVEGGQCESRQVAAGLIYGQVKKC